MNEIVKLPEIPVEIVAKIEAIVKIGKVATREDAETVADGINLAKNQWNRLELERKRWVEPLNGRVKELNALFKSAQEPFSKAEEILKSMQVAWAVAERKRIEVENAAIEAENRRKRDEAETAQRLDRERLADEARMLAVLSGEDGDKAASEAVASTLFQAPPPIEEVVPLADTSAVRSSYGTTSLRMTWTFDVITPNQVPRQYMIVDERAIRAAVSAGVRDIPGVNIYEKPSIVGRG